MYFYEKVRMRVGTLIIRAFGSPPISGNCGRYERKGGQPAQSAMALRDE